MISSGTAGEPSRAFPYPVGAMTNDTRGSYDRVSDEDARRFENELDAKPFDRALLDAFAARLAGMGRVLEIGCGPGQISAYLKQRGADMLGVDLSPGMLDQAGRLHPELDLEEADMRALPLADESVAGIVSFYSIIHIPREEVPAVLDEMRRVLRGDGLLLLAFHLGDEVRHLDSWWDREVSVDFVFFSRDEMEERLVAAGFVIEETQEREPYPDVEAETRRAYVLARRSD